MTKKHGNKYQNKTPLMRFLHKYTGLIIMGVIVLIVGVSYLYYQSEQVFFENWPCSSFISMEVEPSFTDKEIKRFHEILDECNIIPVDKR